MTWTSTRNGAQARLCSFPVMNNVMLLMHRMERKQILRLAANVVPKTLREKTSLSQLRLWAFSGLFLRLTLMPFTTHPDMISIYHEAYSLLKGVFDFYLMSVFGLVHALFLIPYSMILPLDDLIGWKEHGNIPVDFFLNTFLRNPYSNLALFLFKIPFLIFDFGCAIVILRLFETKSDMITAFKFWMVNPVLIYATYMWGRYETIPMFFVLMSLYYAKTGCRFRSLLSLAVAASERVYGIMFVPVFSSILGRNTRERISLLAVGSSIFLVKNIILTKYAGEPTVFELTFLDHLLGTKILTALSQPIHLFVLGYAMLATFYIYSTKRTLDDLWKFALSALLLYYSTCYFFPHYFSWATPFIAIAVTKNKTLTKLYGLQVLFFLFSNVLESGALATTWLLAPLNPSLVLTLPDPGRFLDRFLPSILLISVSRSMLSGACLSMIILIMAKKNSMRA